MKGFRVWSNYWKKYATEAELYMDGSVDAVFEDDGGVPHHENTDIVVEFKTGLKDKNGKEIYEGDVVKYTYRKDYIGQVAFGFVNDSEGYYIEKHYGWGIYSDGSGFSLGDYADDDMRCKLVEIIGNIHENPELLEEEG